MTILFKSRMVQRIVYMLVLSIVFNNTSYGLWPFDLGNADARAARAMGREFFKGMAEGLAQSTQQGGDGAKAAENIARAISKNGFGTFFKETGDLFEKNGQGARAMRNVAGASVRDAAGRMLEEGGNLFDNNKEGSKLFKKFGTSMWRDLGPGLMGFGLQGALVAAVGSAGVASAYYGSKVLWDYIWRELQRPNIIAKSSKQSWWQRFKGMFTKQPVGIRNMNMVFSQELEQRLDTIAKATQTISKKIKAGNKNIKYRNLLLYGPPGTGKTMFAEQLALRSGMEFVVVRSGSLSQEGAIKEIDHLFKWAEKSKRGLVIFIDEVDAFAFKREKMDLNSINARVYNNFLNATGTRSAKFMIIMATNRKDILDNALWRRIDDEVEIKLPGLDERIKLLKLYANKILFNVSHNSKSFVAAAQRELNDEKIHNIAHAIQGLCGGDIEGIINKIKTNADITNAGHVTESIINEVIAESLEKHLNAPKSGAL